MWLFTKYGFYSAVQHKDNPDLVLIRSRVPGDLERLIDLALEIQAFRDKPQIQDSTGTDYRFRIIVHKRAWVMLVCVLGEALDYPNFKDAVHGKPDRDAAYMSVWSTMRDLQARQTIRDYGTDRRKRKRGAKQARLFDGIDWDLRETQQEPVEADWYCHNCGFVPFASLELTGETGARGRRATCGGCGEVIDEEPF